MDKSNEEKWNNFLTPDILRTNIISASVYISAFEILKTTIISRVQDSYKFIYYRINDYDKDITAHPQYQQEVVTKDKNLAHASLKWLKELNAINDDDLKLFNRVKEYRNVLAHEFPKILMEGLPAGLDERFNEIVSLLDKVEKWWFVNYEVPLHEDLQEKEIDEKAIKPGRIISLQILLDVALGSDERAHNYLEYFNNNQPNG